MDRTAGLNMGVWTYPSNHLQHADYNIPGTEPFKFGSLKMKNTMEKNSHLGYWMAGVLLVLVLAFVPIFPGTATYQGVGPATGAKLSVPGGSREFIIEGGKLYLLRQRTRHAILLTT